MLGRERTARKMELTIKGEPKEIAALLLEAAKRQEDEREKAEIHARLRRGKWSDRDKPPTDEEIECEERKELWELRKFYRENAPVTKN